METYDLSKVSAEDFQPYLGQAFQVEFSAGQTVPATIEQVTVLETYSPLERGAFSVVLQTEKSQPVQSQGIYRLHHPAAGSLDVFLVPVSQDRNGLKYEAVFS